MGHLMSSRALFLVALVLFAALSEINAISRSMGILSKRLVSDDKAPSMQPTTQLSSDDNADIYLVFRQKMLDYSVSQGLTILTSRVQQLAIPDQQRKVHVPLLGDFNVALSNIKVEHLDINPPGEQGSSRLAILDGSFHLLVQGVACSISFAWSWEKLGIKDQGQGQLELNQGTLESVFKVSITPPSSSDDHPPSGHPHLDVDMASSFFQSVEVKINSSSADWLYQAILGLFSTSISSKLNQAISNTLNNDVPMAANEYLTSLPTSFDVQGLPFTLSFAYSIYTLAYVLVEGHGSAGVFSSSPLGAEACPFSGPASSLPPTSASAIATDGHMTTLFVHDSVPSCVAWALFTSGGLKTTLVEGTIDGLHLTTDLLAQLIPQLPKTYPKQLIMVEMEALASPRFSFDEFQGIGIRLSYRMTIYVDNSSLGTPLIAQLEADVIATASQLSWESTVISSAVATHKLVRSSLPVPLDRWDQTVAWFIENYAGIYPMKKLFGMFVYVPEASLVSLMDSEGVTYDGGWWALSADVELQPLP